MLMQMLQSGGLDVLTDEQRTADDDNPKGYLEFEPVKRTKEDPSWLDRAHGKAVKIVYRLIHDLPKDRRYRVILMRRDVDEVLASQAAMLARRGEAGANLPPERLGALFEREMEKTLDVINDEACFEVLEVHYRDVVSDPLSQAKAINQFLGGHLDSQAMAAAVQPDLYRQRR